MPAGGCTFATRRFRRIEARQMCSSAIKRKPSRRRESRAERQAPARQRRKPGPLSPEMATFQRRSTASRPWEERAMNLSGARLRRVRDQAFGRAKIVRMRGACSIPADVQWVDSAISGRPRRRDRGPIVACAAPDPSCSRASRCRALAIRRGRYA